MICVLLRVGARVWVYAHVGLLFISSPQSPFFFSTTTLMLHQLSLAEKMLRLRLPMLIYLTLFENRATIYAPRDV